MPELSVIIPAHNAQKYIGALLDSIFLQDFKDVEIILIDDASTDMTGNIVKKYDVRYVRLEENRGPSHARNLGAKMALSENLVFFDADVVLTEGVLRKFFNWLNDGYAQVVNGIYDKYPVNNGLVPLYKAFQEQIWFDEDIKGEGVVVVFNTSVGAIKKKVFWDAGAFNESYRGAEVEDYDFSFRLSKMAKVVLDKSIKVGHNFPYFEKLVKMFFRRSYLWARLFARHRKLSSSGTNLRQAFVMIFYVLSIFLILLTLLFSGSFLLFSGILSFFVALYMDRALLCYNVTNKGILFAIFSICMSIISSLVVVSGVILGFLSVFTENSGSLLTRYIMKGNRCDG